ncbi:MAG TPA: LytTR family DNA-binding domain-containing protein [Steroidobacteraceae bacterium]|nr:LytTR family DNA-binding domain-containing protein [Steroidobacteraceae bacterium]
MPISALIVDDEASARSRLRKLLAPYPFELVAADARDGLEALEAIRAHRPQVVFLDIEMPGLDGFAVVEALTPDILPLIVFVTAYDQYALAAFEANAIAYLLKPVDEQRLQAVCSRIEQLARSPEEAAQAAARTAAVQGTLASTRPQPLHHVLAIENEGYKLIPLGDVCSFQVDDGVTYVKTATESFRTNYAIGSLEARLPSPPFFRAHRATIVNLDKVASINPMFKGTLMLTMKDAARSEIQVSERQAVQLRERLQL